MGKKKTKGEYNDFLDGEKLRDNAEIRTSLHGSTPIARNISPPSPGRQDRESSKPKGQGGPRKPPLTHFLCLPLVTEGSRPQLQDGLKKLKEELATEDLVPTKAVRPVGTLHLTLGVMSLDATKLEQVKQHMQALDLYRLLRDISMQKLAEKAAEDGTIAENLGAAAMPDTDALTVDLESLVPMQAPSKTSILYAEPRDASQRLMPFASAVREQFAKEGLLVEDTRPLKLHATIINTIYAKSGGKRGRTMGGKLKDKITHIEQRVSPHHHGSEDAPGVEDSASADPITQDGERREGHGPDAKSWMRFDAGTLIESYRGFIWAEGVKVDTVQICKMGARKIWSSGTEEEGEVLDEQYEVVCSKGIYE